MKDKSDFCAPSSRALTARQREAIRGSVSVGAAYLDAHFPDWYNRISLNRLDMASFQHCVRGQLARTVGNALLGDILRDYGTDYPAALGMDTFSWIGGGAEVWTLLDETWAHEIEMRR